MNHLHPEETTTSQNISNKLTRETLKYSEALEIANITRRKIITINYFESKQERMAKL